MTAVLVAIASLMDGRSQRNININLKLVAGFVPRFVSVNLVTFTSHRSTLESSNSAAAFSRATHAKDVKGGIPRLVVGCGIWKWPVVNREDQNGWNSHLFQACGRVGPASSDLRSTLASRCFVRSNQPFWAG